MKIYYFILFFGSVLFGQSYSIVKDQDFGTQGTVFNDNQLYNIYHNEDDSFYLFVNNQTILKYNDSGQQILNFGSNGLIYLNNTYFINVFSNGIYSITGNSQNGVQTISKYKHNGFIDNSFGVGGNISVSTPLVSGANNRGTLGFFENKLYFSYYDTVAKNTIMLRYQTNGDIDTSFGDNGKLTFSGILFNSFRIKDSKILAIASSIFDNNYNNGNKVIQYNLDGTKDVSYGNQGTYILPEEYYFPHGFFSSYFFDNQDNLFIKLMRTDSNLNKSTSLKLTKFGIPDTSFHSNGFLEYTSATVYYTNMLIDQQNNVYYYGMGASASVAKFNATGLDTTFNGTGIKNDSALHNFQGGYIQKDNKIVFWGPIPTDSGSSNYSVVRYKNGSLLSSQNLAIPSKISVVPNPVSDNLSITLDESSKINQIEIYDASGRMVKKVSESTNNVNVRNLQSGTYHIKVYTSSKVYFDIFIKK